MQEIFSRNACPQTLAFCPQSLSKPSKLSSSSYGPEKFSHGTIEIALKCYLHVCTKSDISLLESHLFVMYGRDKDLNPQKHNFSVLLIFKIFCNM